MPKKSPEFNETRMREAVAFAQAQKKPNILGIAREFNVTSTTLRYRLQKAKTLAVPTTTKKNALQPYQETALTK